MHAAKSAVASPSQRGPDFRRMMPVIVNHTNACVLAFELEAAVYAAKIVERGADLLRRNVERSAHRNRSCRIQHIVHARNVQREVSQIFLLISNLETDKGPLLPRRQRRSI